MTSHTNTTTARQHGRVTQILILAALLALSIASAARAGSYVIYNCPSAAVANGNPGPWSVFGGSSPKGSCGGGAGDSIAARSGSLGAGSSDGVQVKTPSGITIREAKVSWTVPRELSGATNYALALANGATIGESNTPWETQSTFVLPSSTTSLTLEDYCSADDGPNGCYFAENSSDNLALYGAQLTLNDTNLPTGNVTGGTLTATDTLTGTQDLIYTANDTSSGVRNVKLLVDGIQAAENDDLAQCPYQDFLACPASISNSISWNTATVADGQHSLEAVVEDAAQNTTIIYSATITTNNAPTNTSAPALSTWQPTVGGGLSAQPGAWTAPAAAGTITYGYQWQDCDAQGNNCQAIPAAQAGSYTPTPADAGHTLRVLITASDSDGSTSQATSATSPVTPQNPGAAGGLSGQGAPNGAFASETAIIHLNTTTALHRAYPRRAFTITGTLTDNQGHPITAATLDVLQQIATTNTTTLIQQTTTSASGAFTIPVPAGPSRTITLAYRAYTADPAYAATTTVTESVRAEIHLHINTHYTSSTGTIVLTGTVAGPIPHKGVLLQLTVKYHGEWATIGNPRTRTNSHGTFKIAYQFHDATGRFPFRVDIPAGQTAFPYTEGESNTINITTR